MKFKSLVLLLLLFLLTVPAAAIDVPATFAASDCSFVVPAGADIDCGYLSVQLNRDSADRTMIRLAVAILRHPDGNPLPDPIIYLEGGPGGSALELLNLTYDSVYAPMFAANRDVIIFDQRGVGLSEPALDCPIYDELGVELLDLELEGREISLDEADELLLNAILDCGAGLSQAFALESFNTAASAADVQDLRRALGYDAVNLWGVSYGTKLALTAIRDNPDGIRSVVMDSVYPPEVNIFTESAVNTRRAFDKLFESCAADSACNESFPDLETVFFSTVERLNQEPARIDVINPFTGESYPDTVLDGDSVLGIVFQLLYDTDIIPGIPGLIYRASEGDYSGFAAVAGAIIAQQEIFSMGMHFSVQCREEIPFTRQGEIAAAYQQFPELTGRQGAESSEDIFSVCASFDSSAAAPLENQPIRSSVPVLALAGEFDPITPPSWALSAVEALDNAYYFEIPNAGHGASLGQDCPREMALAFFGDPSTAPDSSCLSDMGLVFAGTSAAAAAPVNFVPLNLAPFNINATTVIPESWEEQAALPGLFARAESALDQTAIFFTAVPGITDPQEIADLFSSQFGAENLEVADTLQTDYAEWRIFQLNIQGENSYFAIAPRERGSVLVLFVGDEALKESILLPILSAFEEQDRGQF